jgi:hypothetical protein
MTATMPRVTASDVTGLKSVPWSPSRANLTVLEMVDDLVNELQLPQADSGGQPIVYAARRESDGMALSASEQVVDVLGDAETVVLEPDVNAG